MLHQWKPQSEHINENTQKQNNLYIKVHGVYHGLTNHAYIHEWEILLHYRKNYKGLSYSLY